MADKAQIIALEGPDAGIIEVMFNPNEYTVSHESTYNGEKDKKQFEKYEKPEFRVSLFYDTYEKRQDVRRDTARLVSLMYPTVPGKETKRPPVCVFSWGKFTYRGIITKIEQKFTMFLSSGIPVRSTIDVTFQSKETEIQQKLNEGREACRKLWVVKSGDRLDLIANEALKDPLKWRKIAEANKINNPFGFPTKNDFGRTLVIPD